MKIDFELIEKQNFQIPTRNKIYYYLAIIVIPFFLIGTIFSFLNEWILFAVFLVFMFFNRSVLDFPSQSLVIDYLTLFKPLQAVKARFKLVRPNENDLRTFNKINILYKVFTINYIIIQIAYVMIVLFLIIALVLMLLN